MFDICTFFLRLAYHCVKDINGCWRKIAHRQAEQAAPLRSSGPLGVVGAVKVHSTSTRALAHGPQGCWPSHPLVYGKKSQTPAQALVKIDLRFSSNGIAHKWTLWPPYPWLSTSSLRGSALSAQLSIKRRGLTRIRNSARRDHITNN